MSIDFFKIKRVLVAKLRHHGDVLLTSPVFSILKSRFPHLEIDAYLYQETLPMLEGHPGISRFLLYDKNWKTFCFFKRGLREVALLKKIRKRRYDLVINLTEGDRGAIAAKVSQASYAVGFDPQGKGMKGKKGCYTHLIQHTSRPRHTVEKQLDALRCLGIFPLPEERELFFNIPKPLIERMSERLPERFILFHPVSRWMFKALPIETVVRTICYLQNRGNQVVLTGSSNPVEVEMNRQIAAQTSNVIDLSGTLCLKELGAVIQKSALVVTVDSLPLHLSSALKKPVVAIFGPTCDQNWGPYKNPQAYVVTPSMTCRPCYQPGCGGSGKSDCLRTLSELKIIETLQIALDTLQRTKFSPK